MQCKKAGIARETVYYHFKSKEDVLDALIERHCERLLKEAEQIAADTWSGCYKPSC
ncbi:TetR/AcrR family transcriptional regulator [Oscillibacter sp.]|uniref:TetR/AcrR family transcriptional regulator n=1 Tax=Oscillibacter sp. TaxID=1945593 RepID=UPI0037CB8831